MYCSKATSKDHDRFVNWRSPNFELGKDYLSNVDNRKRFEHFSLLNMSAKILEILENFSLFINGIILLYLI